MYTGPVLIGGQQPFGRIRLQIPRSGSAEIAEPADERGNVFISNQLVGGSVVVAANNEGASRKVILSTLDADFAGTVNASIASGTGSIHLLARNPAIQLIANSNDPALASTDFYVLSTIPNQYDQAVLGTPPTLALGYGSNVLMETDTSRYKTIWSVGQMRADYNQNVALSAATVNDWYVTDGEYVQTFFASPTLAVTFNGWNAALRLGGANKRFWNAGPYPVTFEHQNLGSSATARFITQNTGPLVCPVGGAVDLIYDTVASRWRIFLASPQVPYSVQQDLTLATYSSLWFVRISNASGWLFNPQLNVTINGIAPEMAIPAPSKTLWNVGANNITLTHESISATATNRIITASAANILIPPRGGAELTYDTAAQRWRAVSLYSASNTPTTSVRTLDYGNITATDLDVQLNNQPWAGRVYCDRTGLVNRISAVVTQAAAGDIFAAIYTGYYNPPPPSAQPEFIVSSSPAVSASTVGLKEFVLSSAVTLTEGQYYYLAIRCTANGSRFAGGACTNAITNVASNPVSMRHNTLLSWPANFVSNAIVSQIPFLNAYYVF
jgi:hypothetical protein